MDITKRLKEIQETKERIIYKVKSGKSSTFNEWQKWGLITEEEFIEAIEWLSEDPLSKDGKFTRSLGLKITHDMENKIIFEQNPKFALDYDEGNLKGSIVKLERKYKKDSFGITAFTAHYDIETGKLYGGNGRHRVLFGLENMI